MNSFSNLVPKTSEHHDILFDLYSSNVAYKNFDELSSDIDKELLERVNDLQCQRIQQETLLDQHQEQIKRLKEEHQEFLLHAKHIDSKLKETDAKILRFRRQKIQELNEQMVPSFVAISSDQIENEANTVEHDFLIFPSDKLKALQDRIPSLTSEIESDKQLLHKLVRVKSALTKDKLSKEKELEEQELKCNNLQMLKFGRLIDIEKIDEILSESRTGKKEADFEYEMNRLSEEHDKELRAIQSDMDSLSEQLLNTTKENTLLWKETAQLKSRKLFLSQQNQQINSSSDKENVSSVVDVNEIRQLEELVQTQANRISNLRSGIQLLSRKSGHINPDLIHSIVSA